MIGFSTVAEPLFCRTPPGGCLCAKKKNERNEIVCFYRTKSGIFLCGIARFSGGNKNKLRTFQSQNGKKIKNSQPQTKFTGSYKKKSVVSMNALGTEPCFNIFFESTIIYQL